MLALTATGQVVQNLAYLAAAILFVFALKAMASPRTARQGNLVGAVGMLIAIIVALAYAGRLNVAARPPCGRPGRGVRAPR